MFRHYFDLMTAVSDASDCASLINNDGGISLSMIGSVVLELHCVSGDVCGIGIEICGVVTMSKRFGVLMSKNAEVGS